MEITGELKQNETPSPENPVEIENEIYTIKDGKKIKLERTDMIRLFEQELKVATEKEKTADELFEELGYKKLNKKELKLSFDDDFLELLLCVYEAPMYNFIYFYKDKTFNFTTTKDMQELKAINKKVEELGWK